MYWRPSPKVIKLNEVDLIESSRNESKEHKDFIKRISQKDFANVSVLALTGDQLIKQEQYASIKSVFKRDFGSTDPKTIKVLVFPAIGADGKQEDYNGPGKSFSLFFINANGTNYITSNGVSSHSARASYFNLVAGSNACQVVEDNYVIAGHCDDNLIFKIPWKKEWGDGLPASHDVNGFNTLYNAIQQQNQVPTTNTQDPPPMITLFYSIDSKPQAITLTENNTVHDVVQRIKQKTKASDIKIIYNAQELKDNDTRTLLDVPISNNATLTVTQIKQNINDTQQNQNQFLLKHNYDNSLDITQKGSNATISDNQAPQNNTNINNSISSSSVNYNPLKGRPTYPDTKFLSKLQLQQMRNASGYYTQNRNPNYLSSIIANNPYHKRYYNAHLKGKRRNPNSFRYPNVPLQYNKQPIALQNSIVMSAQPQNTNILNQNQVIPSNQNISYTNPPFNIKLNTSVRPPQYGPVPAQTHVAPVPVRVPTFFASRQQRTNNPPERYKLEKANGPIDPMRRYRMFDGYGFLYSQKPIKTWPSERGLQMWTDDPTAYYRFQ